MATLFAAAIAAGLGARRALAQCQVAKLLPADGAAGDGFGWAVSVAGEIGVIGAPGDDDQGSGSGAAYVFERSANLWVELAKLTADDAAVDDLFGWSVSVSGEVAVVGVPYDDDYGARSGSVYVFERGPSGWGQMAKLTPVDAGEGDYFGYSTAVSEDVLVVGAPHDDDNGFRSGSAYVFERDEDGNWSQVGKLLADDGDYGDNFGYTVAVDGDVIAVGVPDDEDLGNWSGSAYVFERDQSGSWSQVGKLLASDGGPLESFGASVAVSANVVLVGAPNAWLGDWYVGAAYVFERARDGAWTQTAKLMAEDADLGDSFGSSVGLSAEIAVVGAPGDDEQGQATGAAYTFIRQADGTWSQVAKLLAEDGAQGDRFGRRLAVSGNMAVIAAHEDDENGQNSGSAYVFAVGRDEDGDGVMDACECPGDLNKDWIVDYRDVLVLLEDWGCTGGDCPGDIDGDGDTDQADLGLLLANWANIWP